ncbi:MORN repeat-containing protein [Maribacter aestuarii]|uniref:MORN repeat-containing protein n=1 Tax=Maribacter aestuarii TaxID=1130723 RepID=UPI00248C0F05|nr:hypothetical protein [Maribacter aestuarii]
MHTRKRTIFIYTTIAAIAISALFFVVKSIRLQRRLEDITQKQAQEMREMRTYRQLLKIDSILAKGEYETALRAYSSEIEDKDMVDNSAIQLRIAVAEQLLQFKAGEVLNRGEMIQLDSLDSIQSNRSLLKKEVNAYDSLNFALEKAKVQLRGMREQLRTKSFGEYLNFKSSKGDQMHYVGQVKNNQANGLGVAILNTGSRYEGEWKGNQRHGEGTFYWPDGEYYVGSYLNDKRNGLGTYYWPNGEKYVGQWKDDKRNGKGAFYGKDGDAITKGVWKNDKLIEEEKNNPYS